MQTLTVSQTSKTGKIIPLKSVTGWSILMGLLRRLLEYIYLEGRTGLVCIGRSILPLDLTVIHKVNQASLRSVFPTPVLQYIPNLKQSQQQETDSQKRGFWKGFLSRQRVGNIYGNRVKDLVGIGTLKPMLIWLFPFLGLMNSLKAIALFETDI